MGQMTTKTPENMTVPALIASMSGRLGLDEALAACTDDELVSLAYGEFAPVPLLADVPAWLAEAAYDEHDRRMMVSGRYGVGANLLTLGS